MPSVIRGSDNFDSTGGNAVKARVNFTTALADANYAPQVTGKSDGVNTGFFGTCANAAQTTSALRVATLDDGAASRDSSQVSVTIFR